MAESSSDKEDLFKAETAIALEALAVSTLRWSSGSNYCKEDIAVWYTPGMKFKAEYVAKALLKNRSSRTWTLLEAGKRKTYPAENVSVLVRHDLVGSVYDVAIFTGWASGGPRWLMGDIELDPTKITHWSYILEPEDIDGES